MTVYLYIVRHGEAESLAENDELRKLTEHGEWEAKRTALWLKTQVTQFQQVYVSPYVRAQQTKDIIIEKGPDALDVEVLGELIPDGNAKTVVDYMLANSTSDSEKDWNILCVSHMPLVSYMIGEVTGYTPIMATAGVAQIKLDIENWRGQLDALLSPEQML